jgi:hypothetical protein
MPWLDPLYHYVTNDIYVQASIVIELMGLPFLA